ncbi:unnamed protein product [Rangifer tarandus platyrhynchus]|uniref:Secreted protein n=1 Tax=Rangifer tarandus platyrhynchus TaxID=3082113 RepID=A0ABN8ZG88_RANTA|nr:unnamed protein product [Rangifer tarandus platyrhynchus]
MSTAALVLTGAGGAAAQLGTLTTLLPTRRQKPTAQAWWVMPKKRGFRGGPEPWTRADSAFLPLRAEHSAAHCWAYSSRQPSLPYIVQEDEPSGSQFSVPRDTNVEDATG